MFISEPVDIASSPCVVRVGPEAVDSHHTEEKAVQYIDQCLRSNDLNLHTPQEVRNDRSHMAHYTEARVQV